MPILEINGVSMRFPRKHGMMSSSQDAVDLPEEDSVLNNVSVAVNPGESMGLVGESGAGKSTLAALAVGLLKPTTGSISINGIEDGDRPDFARRASSVQLVWQNASGSLDPRMKIGRAIAEPLMIRRQDTGISHLSVVRLMEEVGLGKELADRYPHELSGGEIQRAVIARALAMDPGLLILDEPASALDARVKIRIIDLLKRLRHERGIAYIIIAHDLSLVRDLTERLLIIYRGEIVERGKTKEVLSNPAHDYTRRLIESIPSLKYAPGTAG